MAASAQQVLDEVHALARLDAFDPEVYLARLAGELPAEAATIDELAARDEQLRGALSAIDAFAARAMKIRLDHALAADNSIPAPTRKVFAGTVLSYATSLDTLRERVRDVASRLDPRGAAATADLVVAAAQATLGMRDALRAGVLARARSFAEAALPAAVARAKDLGTDDKLRERWSAVRRDLETIALRPEAIAAASHADRLAAWPALLDEPQPEPERTFGELLELD
jgi:hypothetical protein